jgi:hypothetical protein
MAASRFTVMKAVRLRAMALYSSAMGVLLEGLGGDAAGAENQDPCEQ